MAWRDVGRIVRRSIADILEIPGDVVLNLPKIVLVGNVQVFIENHRGIVEYTPERVRVIVGSGEVAVNGADLAIRNILPDEICVDGHIRSVEFL